MRKYYPCGTYGYNDHSNDWQRKRKKRLKEEARSADISDTTNKTEVSDETNSMREPSLPKRDGESR